MKYQRLKEEEPKMKIKELGVLNCVVNTIKIWMETEEKLRAVDSLNHRVSGKLSYEQLCGIAVKVPFSVGEVEQVHNALPPHLRSEESLLSALNLLSDHGYSIDKVTRVLTNFANIGDTKH